MKIERTPLSATLVGEGAKTKKDKNTDVQAASSVVAQIRYDQTRTQNDVNMEKVNSVRQAISEGRYEVNADKIAESLIDSVRQMLDVK